MKTTWEYTSCKINSYSTCMNRKQQKKQQKASGKSGRSLHHCLGMMVSGWRAARKAACIHTQSGHLYLKQTNKNKNLPFTTQSIVISERKNFLGGSTVFLMPALPPPMLFSVPPQKFRRTRTLPKEITSAKVSRLPRRFGVETGTQTGWGTGSAAVKSILLRQVTHWARITHLRQLPPLEHIPRKISQQLLAKSSLDTYPLTTCNTSRQAYIQIQWITWAKGQQNQPRFKPL